MKGIKNEGITEFYTQRSCRGLRGCGWMLAEEAIAIQNEILPPNPTASARRNYPSDTPIYSFLVTQTSLLFPWYT